MKPFWSNQQLIFELRCELFCPPATQRPCLLQAMKVLSKKKLMRQAGFPRKLGCADPCPGQVGGEEAKWRGPKGWKGSKVSLFPQKASEFQTGGN